MEITYLGHSSFRIKTKASSIVTDPFDPEMVGLKYSGVSAEIVTVSHEHKDHNAVSRVAGVRKVISGPGEYEISGISIIGIQTFHDEQKGEKRGKNTIYIIEADGLRLVHLGDLGHKLSENVVEQIGDCDILMIPVGGEFTIGPKEASEVVSQIDPFFVIPMHYKTSGLKEETFSKLHPVDGFLKETGLPVENIPKFTIKKEDIKEDLSTKVIVLGTKTK